MRSSLRPLAIATVLALVPHTGNAQESVKAAAKAVFHRAVFVSYQQASISGVPISYDRSGFGGERVNSSGTGGAFGIGVSGMADNGLLFQLGYDQADARLTDWRVKDRKVSFSSVDLTIGYAFAGPVAVAPYFSFSPGWYRQSGYKKFDFNSTSFESDSSRFEALEDFDYMVGWAIGIKAGFARFFALNAESRWYREDTGGGACGSTPNCIDISDSPPAAKYGFRTSVGLQVYFGW